MRNEIWKIVLGVVSSVGGIGVVYDALNKAVRAYLSKLDVID